MPFFLFVASVLTIVLLAVPGGPMLTVVVEGHTGSPGLAGVALIVWWSLLACLFRELLRELDH